VRRELEGAARDAAARLRLQLQARLGFALWVGPSQAPTGPYEAGVYLRGRAAPGAIVALFPGAVYNSEMLHKAVDCGHLANPDMPRTLVPRFDESVIDCFAELAGSGAGGGAGGSEEPPRPRDNAFALAHHVRHPPPLVAPNVMRLQVDFVDEAAADEGAGGGGGGAGGGAGRLMPFPLHLRPYIPNAWGSDIAAGQALYGMLEQHVVAKGAVLVALRPLRDEELFVDQTLNAFARQARLVPPWAEAQWAARRDLRRLSGTLPEASAALLRGEARAAEIRDAREAAAGAPRAVGGGAGAAEGGRLR
jgi:hypothetical protein